MDEPLKKLLNPPQITLLFLDRTLRQIPEGASEGLSAGTFVEIPADINVLITGEIMNGVS